MHQCKMRKLPLLQTSRSI